MVHPDYQYTPTLVPAMAGMIASGVYDMVLGSRILGAGALKGGMPFYKYVANRFLTAFQNLFLGVKLSEYHTGFRAFSRQLLETLPLLENSDDFVFDNQMIAQAVMFGFLHRRRFRARRNILKRRRQSISSAVWSMGSACWRLPRVSYCTSWA